MLVDLRSDTVTRPTPGMRAAMAEAEVGDDVFGEDPTVNLLEQRTAALFGKEAGLFCPSGTMTNQIAVNVHTRPGDEVLCEEGAHIYRYEGGGGDGEQWMQREVLVARSRTVHGGGGAFRSQRPLQSAFGADPFGEHREHQ